ncbi:MAG TPA: hypothetical protein DDY92_02320 [Dialister sp.]|nr:hypothetical protein [Dialister sp.]
MEDNKDYKVTWKGWVALFFLIVLFSGTMGAQEGWMKAFDLNSLVGAFGKSEGAKVAFIGTGGFGAKEGMLVGLSLIPTVMVAQGLLDVCESYGAIKAAAKLFQPILKPLLGIPGVAGLAFVSSFTSSDVGAFITKDMFENGLINDDERTVFAAYQYAGSGTVNNTIAAGAALVPISVLPVGAIIGLIVVVKILGANFVRMYLKFYHKKHPEGGKI